MPDKSSWREWLGRTRNLVWVAVVLAGIGALSVSYYQKRQAIPQIGGAFALTDQNGKRVTDEDLKGKILVVYFGFTHCPDACPTALQAIGAALEKLPADVRAQVVPVFITLDPARDTPDVMGEYVDGFIPGGLGLSGTAEEIAEAARAYRIGYQKRSDPNSALPYTIDHANIIYIMGRNGKLVRFYTNSVELDELVEGIAEAVRKN